MSLTHCLRCQFMKENRVSVRNRLEAYDDGPNSTHTLGSAMCLQYQCRCVYFTNNTMYVQQKYVYIVTRGPYLRLDFATCIIRLVDRTKRERERERVSMMDASP